MAAELRLPAELNGANAAQYAGRGTREEIRPIGAQTTYTPLRKTLAWMVHLLTASGAVVGFLAIIAIGRGQWVQAFGWMAVSVFIDSIDGMLARACKVKEVLPNFDGALLDNIVDYFTYVIVPASFLYETHSMPTSFNLVSAVLITLASAYQFCQAEAKTEDHCFLGFPSYWNVVALYLFLLDWPEWVNFVIVAVLAAGVFIPVKYLYPSRTATLRPLNLLLTAIWALSLVMALWRYPQGHLIPVYASLAYVAYYLAISAYLNTRRV